MSGGGYGSKLAWRLNCFKKSVLRSIVEEDVASTVANWKGEVVNGEAENGEI